MHTVRYLKVKINVINTEKLKLATLKKILFRCQSPVVIGPDSDNLAVCGLCRYAFCKSFKEIFHSQTMCPKDYLIEQMKLQHETECQRLKEEREAVLVQIRKTQTPKESLEQQQIAKQRYC
ncbi:unnamed protein product [Rotaria magnacalcarata]|uniref:Uncharacterized protein n=1 Tax=Rotaria magnacalcarata TaxID=392030 RepID=A0A816GYC4_9BILA|nr:unnamed protein product [Rotaria magnacalcarata]CAF1679289.1 unnamed protein product [Rotaria magnacalcarata]CAF2226764.1 unnamed protein product [Rotaria magnacalcarata]CAF4005900.1 unnamed protein product [Rotaria magnacalcarata]CAF4321956.1 unnamed protein product [Rotaria magnacalcarata]